MKSQKNHILSLLIVAGLVSVGSSARETFGVTMPVITKVQLRHPALSAPLTVAGSGDIVVSGTTVNLGTFHLTGPLHAKVLIDWAPGKIYKKGWFIARGQAHAKFVNPTTGFIEHIDFKVITRGRTNSVARAVGRYRDYATSVPGSHLRRGKYHH